jgi:hypothetical protein
MEFINGRVHIFLVFVRLCFWHSSFISWKNYLSYSKMIKNSLDADYVINSADDDNVAINPSVVMSPTRLSAVQLLDRARGRCLTPFWD